MIEQQHNYNFPRTYCVSSFSVISKRELGSVDVDKMKDSLLLGLETFARDYLLSPVTKRHIVVEEFDNSVVENLLTEMKLPTDLVRVISNYIYSQVGTTLCITEIAAVVYFFAKIHANPDSCVSEIAKLFEVTPAKVISDYNRLFPLESLVTLYENYLTAGIFGKYLRKLGCNSQEVTKGIEIFRRLGSKQIAKHFADKIWLLYATVSYLCTQSNAKQIYDKFNCSKPVLKRYLEFIAPRIVGIEIKSKQLIKPILERIQVKDKREKTKEKVESVANFKKQDSPKPMKICQNKDCNKIIASNEGRYCSHDCYRAVVNTRRKERIERIKSMEESGLVPFSSIVEGDWIIARATGGKVLFNPNKKMTRGEKKEALKINEKRWKDIMKFKSVVDSILSIPQKKCSPEVDIGDHLFREKYEWAMRYELYSKMVKFWDECSEKNVPLAYLCGAYQDIRNITYGHVGKWILESTDKELVVAFEREGKKIASGNILVNPLTPLIDFRASVAESIGTLLHLKEMKFTGNFVKDVNLEEGVCICPNCSPDRNKQLIPVFLKMAFVMDCVESVMSIIDMARSIEFEILLQAVAMKFIGNKVALG